MVGLFSKTKKSKPAGMLGIEAGPQGIALAQVVRAAGARPMLPYCEHLEGSADAQAALLEKTVSERALQGLPANVLLHPSEYQMFLLEAPEVPPQELRDAMRWRIKDMISQSLDDVVIDCFALPEDAYRGRTRSNWPSRLSQTFAPTWTRTWTFATPRRRQ